MQQSEEENGLLSQISLLHRTNVLCYKGEISTQESSF